MYKKVERNKFTEIYLSLLPDPAKTKEKNEGKLAGIVLYV
jgi:hypothetical protein